MTDTTATKIESTSLSYLGGVALVLMRGVYWSTMGLDIRSSEMANVWQILFFYSWALGTFLFVLFTFRSEYKPILTIRRVGTVGTIEGIGLVFAFAGAMSAVM